MAGQDTQLLKGVLPMLLLSLLAEEEDYGYAIVVRLHRHGFDGLVEGTVYPALSRLEAKGLLASRLVASVSGPARKYYRLTRAGTEELDRSAQAFAELAANAARLMGSAALAGDLADDPPRAGGRQGGREGEGGTMKTLDTARIWWAGARYDWWLELEGVRSAVARQLQGTTLAPARWDHL